MSGDEVIAEMKRDPRSRKTRVLMLTAKAEEADELVGFTLGADDYVCKPFSMKLLMARVEAVLRRRGAASEAEEAISVGPLRLDRSRHEAKLQDRRLTLTTTEFRLLETLMAAQERVLSREQLIDAVLGPSVVVTDRTIDVHIAALRKKLGMHSGLIQTIRGVGYTLRAAY
jgi:two-component system phosphate regulon response regulator PhoB